jgi:GPH family glycoside/pentoside/hexuronide:cation symporter
MDFSDARGFQLSVVIYATIAAFFFIMTYAWTKERLKPVAGKTSIKDDLKDLAKNGQWFIMLGACIAVLIFNSLRDGSIQYYFKYYVQNQTFPLFGEVAWEKLSGAYMTIWLASNMLGVLLANPVSSKIGKRSAFIFAMILAAVFSVWLFFMTPDDILAIFVLNVFIGLAAGIVLPLIWSMYADISDYSEHKTGRRATGLIFSSSSMSQKMGWTLGGAITGWILAAYGFEANAIQSEESIIGIRMLISIYPAVGAGIAVLFLLAYRLSDRVMEQITFELREKRGY